MDSAAAAMAAAARSFIIASLMERAALPAVTVSEGGAAESSVLALGEAQWQETTTGLPTLLQKGEAMYFQSERMSGFFFAKDHDHGVLRHAATLPLPCATRWSLAAAATLFSMEWRRTKPSNRWKDGYFNHFAADAVLYGTRRTDYEVDRRKRRGEEGRRESMKIALKAGIRSHAMGKREG